MSVTFVVILLCLKDVGKSSARNSRSKKSNIRLPNDQRIDLLLVTDECLTDDVPKTGLIDDTETCPQAYVDLYQELPDGSDLSDKIGDYVTKCAKKTCEATCYGLFVDAANKPSTYTSTHKASFKTNCKPTGANAIAKDICYEGDDTKLTGLTDGTTCLDDYKALIEKLPDPVSRKAYKNKNKNQTFLAEANELFTAYAKSCKNTICSSDDCYNTIVKTAPTTYDGVLKTAITGKCNPNKSTNEESNYGFPGTKVHNALTLMGLLIISIHLWL
jgi:hypothetical protein